MANSSLALDRCGRADAVLWPNLDHTVTTLLLAGGGGVSDEPSVPLECSMHFGWEFGMPAPQWARVYALTDLRALPGRPQTGRRLREHYSDRSADSARTQQQVRHSCALAHNKQQAEQVFRIKGRRQLTHAHPPPGKEPNETEPWPSRSTTPSGTRSSSRTTRRTCTPTSTRTRGSAGSTRRASSGAS